MMKKEHAFNLAAFRIIFFGALLGNFLSPHFEYLSTWAKLPESSKVGLPFISSIVEWTPVSPEIYAGVLYVAITLCFFVLIGFFTRVSNILLFLCTLYLFGVPTFFGKVNHNHIVVWTTLFMSLTDTGRVLSIDNLLRKKRPAKKLPISHFKHGLPFKFLWFSLAIIYFFSGIHKLLDVGLEWALGNNLRNQILLEWAENYNQIPSIRIDQYPSLIRFGGLLILTFELTYPIFILSQLSRTINFAGSWFLHISAGYFMFIDFAILRICHLSMIPWNKVIEKLNLKSSFSLFQVEVNKKNRNKLPKSIMTIGFLVIGINLLLSYFNISSFPFSAYPSYSTKVPNYIAVVEIDAMNDLGQKIDIKEVAKAKNFRWEDIRVFEERIANNHQSMNPKSLEKALNSYLSIWVSKIDTLKAVTEVEFKLIKTSLEPEKRDSILDAESLGKLKF